MLCNYASLLTCKWSSATSRSRPHSRSAANCAPNSRWIPGSSSQGWSGTEASDPRHLVCRSMCHRRWLSSLLLALQREEAIKRRISFNFNFIRRYFFLFRRKKANREWRHKMWSEAIKVLQIESLCFLHKIPPSAAFLTRLERSLLCEATIESSFGFNVLRLKEIVQNQRASSKIHPQCGD